MLTIVSDAVRRSISPASRRTLKRWVDPVLSPVGSIQGARTFVREVALTFDDGPDPDVTPKLLNLLKARGVSTTFFVLTEKASAYPAIVRRMVEEGHEVALHFDRHDRLTQVPLAEARRRLRAARIRLEELAGPVRYFRPPFGAQSLITYLLARFEGLEVVAWGPYAEDWVEQLPATAAGKALADLKGGDIVLLHDGVEKPDGEELPTFDRVRMVELVLDGLAERGLRAATVGRLMELGGVRRTVWFRR